MASSTISIEGIDKAKLFAALFNHAKPRGIGIFSYIHNRNMAEEEARSELQKKLVFRLHEGRVLAVDLSGDVLDTTIYNANNGLFLAEEIIAEIRAEASEHETTLLYSLIKQSQSEGVNSREEFTLPSPNADPACLSETSHTSKLSHK